MGTDTCPQSDPAEPAVLDGDHLERQTFGDRALEAELLDLFEAQCTQLAPSLSGPDRNEQREAAHSLKGAALAVGANELAALAATLEEGRLNDDAINRAGGVAPMVRGAIERVIAAIARRRGVAA